MLNAICSSPKDSCQLLMRALSGVTLYINHTPVLVRLVDFTLSEWDTPLQF
jgi:hypothetical protein